MILAEARPAYDYPVKPATRQTQKVARRTRTIVRKRSAVSPRTRYVVLWLIAVTLALGLASRYAVAARITVDIAGLNKQLAEVKAENQQLQLQVSESKSLARIEQVASTRLGMIRPTEARPLVTASNANTMVVAADISDNTNSHGWIASIQRWLSKLVRTGRAEAKGL